MYSFPHSWDSDNFQAMVATKKRRAVVRLILRAASMAELATAFHAIDAASQYVLDNDMEDFTFCFTSAAESGTPEIPGGELLQVVLPDCMNRYLVAKRAVENT
eukprot:scaffold45304_cov191-Amphora_coffeaeformis.AAC.2